MKKHYLVFAAFLSVAVSATLSSQSIINGGFETWTNTSYEQLSNWYTSAGESKQKLGVTNITKVSDKVSGNFAVKLETKIVGTDSVFAFFANGDPGNPEGQGIPFSQPVTHIKGYFKNANVGSDAGLLWLIFKKAGVVIQDTMYVFPGINANYTPFMLDLKLTQTPDTVIIAGASSNPFTPGNLKDGSWIQFDSLAFDNNGTKISIFNGNFENWEMITLEDPFSWATNNYNNNSQGTPHAQKTTDKTAGNFAIKLTTRYSDNNYNTNISSGYFTQNGDKGGDPYYGNIKDTLIGYYKYIPQGSDSGNITVKLTKNGVNVSNNGNSLTPIGTYTYFEIPFNCSQLADTIRVYLSSSNWPVDQSNVGSELFVDGLMLKSELPTSVKEYLLPFKNSLFPNPARDYIAADIYLKEVSDVAITIYDITGKVVYKNHHSTMPTGKNQFRINTSSFNPGIYIYELKAGEFTQSEKFIVK